MDVSGDYSFLFLAYYLRSSINRSYLIDYQSIVRCKIDVCNTRHDRLRDVDILEKVEWYQLKIK